MTVRDHGVRGLVQPVNDLRLLKAPPKTMETVPVLQILQRGTCT